MILYVKVKSRVIVFGCGAKNDNLGLEIFASKLDSTCHRRIPGYCFDVYGPKAITRGSGSPGGGFGDFGLSRWSGLGCRSSSPRRSGALGLRHCTDDRWAISAVSWP